MAGDCVTATTCQVDSCNEHGTCDDSLGAVVCSCDAGWTGPVCDTCDAGYVMTAGNCVLGVAPPSPPDLVTLEDATPVAGQQADLFTNDLSVTLIVQQPGTVDSFCVLVDDVTAPSPADGCWASTLPTAVTLAQEGLHMVMVWTRNDTGGVSSAGTVGTITLDLTPPALTFDSPADASATDASQVAAAGTVADLNGVLLFTIDGVCPASTCTYGAGGWAYDPLLLPVLGTNVMAVHAVDAAGNTTALMHTIERTATGPEPVNVLGAPGNTAVLLTSVGEGVAVIAWAELGSPGDETTADGALDLLLGQWFEFDETVEPWIKANDAFDAADFGGTTALGDSGKKVRALTVAPWSNGGLSGAFGVGDSDEIDRLYQRVGGTWTNIAADTIYPDDNALLAGAVKEQTSGFVFIDYDLDGDLDVYRVTGSSAAASLSDVLLTNIGTTPEGVWMFEKLGAGAAAAEHVGLFSGGLAVGDFDRDGRDDIFVTSNSGALYLNQTETAGVPAFAVYPSAAQPFDFNGSDAFGTSSLLRSPVAFDYDNDGDLDLYVTAFGLEPNRLYRNELAETGTFGLLDVTTSTLALVDGTDKTADTTGAVAGDIDNDGDQDLYVTSHEPTTGARLLRNDHVMPDGSAAIGGPSFAEITLDALRVLGHITHGASFVDHDGDGDLDLFVTVSLGSAPGLWIFKNTYYEQGGVHRHLRVKVTVNGQVNPLGTKVVVDHGLHSQMQQYMPVAGAGSMAHPTLHFGVGDATTVDEVRVYAPGAATPSYVANNVPTSASGAVETITLP